MAQSENVQKRQRQALGIRARVRRGLPANHWPHGYGPVRDERGRVIGGQFIPDEIEAVKIATRLFLQGMGYERIAIELNKTPYKSRRKGTWQYITVRRMLNNDTYAGLVHYAEVRITEPSDKFPILWDQDTYAQIVAERAKRRQGGKYPTSLASSIVTCIKCGKGMVINVCNGYSYFRCPTHAASFRTGIKCHTNHIREDTVIEALDKLHQQLNEQEPSEIDARLSNTNGERERLLAEMERLQVALAADRQGLARLAQFISAGAIDINAAATENQRLVEIIEEKTARIAAIERELLLLPSLDERRERLRAVLDIPDLTGADKMTVRQALVNSGIRVWVKAGQIVRIDV